MLALHNNMTGTAYGEIEVVLDRSQPESYEVELRVIDPGTEGEIAPVRGQARISIEELSALQSQPDEYGEKLADQLFGDSGVREFYARNKASFDSRGLMLRLRVLIEPSVPELHAVRWELLRDPETKSPLATSERILFSRFMLSRDWRLVKLRRKAELKALIAVAAPSDALDRGLEEVDHAGEVERAREALSGIKSTAFEEHQPVTLDRLLDGLRQGVDILYLVCHGAIPKGQEPCLYLQNEAGNTEPVPAAALAQRIQELQEVPRLVVVASCQSAAAGDGTSAHSALAPRLAEAGVPAVVAMQGKISMQTVKLAMPVFFRELVRDGRIDRAMAVARGVIRERRDYWMPVLFLRLSNGLIWDAGEVEVGAGAKSYGLHLTRMLLPTALIASLVLASMFWRMPARIDIDATVNQVKFDTTDGGKPQVVLARIEADSLGLKGFQEIRLTPQAISIFDPNKFDIEHNRYAENGWHTIPVPAGDLVLTPLPSGGATILIEPLPKTGSAGSVQVGPIYALGATHVTLSTPEPGVLSLQLRGPQQPGSVELPKTFILQVSSCSLNIAALPYASSSMTLRVELSDASGQLLSFTPLPSGTLFQPGFATNQDVPLLDGSGLDIAKVDFFSAGVLTPDPQTTLEGPGQIHFDGHPETVDLAAGDLLKLDSLTNFHVFSTDLYHKDGGQDLLRVNLGGTAATLQSGKMGFLEDRRLTLFDVAKHDRKLAALFVIVLLWLAPTVIAGRKFLGAIRRS